MTKIRVRSRVIEYDQENTRRDLPFEKIREVVCTMCWQHEAFRPE